ncbi:LPO_1073/Vpar_1526 family protein [Pseudarthrobacter sp. MDT1-22]
MKFTQDGGDSSTNYQAQGNITVHTGVSATEVYDITERVVKSNMKDLVNLARETVDERINSFAEELGERLAQLPATHSAALSDPDVQYAISNAGIAYARRGTEELSEILLDLVSDRVVAPSDSLIATILNDAIEIAPRLTKGERAALAIIWTFLRTVNPGADSLENLRFYHEPILREFGPDLPKREGSYLHLQSMGCISTSSLGGSTFASAWYNSYPGFFQEGLSLDNVSDEIKGYWDDSTIFEESPRGEDLKQVAGGGASDSYLAQLDIPQPHVQALKTLRDRRLPDATVVAMVKAAIPEVLWLEDAWGHVGATAPTGVGIAIGHSVLQQRFGYAPDLSDWLDEG